MIEGLKVDHVELLKTTDSHHEYRGQKLPVYAIHYDHPDLLVAYVDAKSGIFKKYVTKVGVGLIFCGWDIQWTTQGEIILTIYYYAYFHFLDCLLLLVDFYFGVLVLQPKENIKVTIV